MKKIWFGLFFLPALFSFSTPENTMTINDFGWLKGRWKSESEQGVFYETWNKKGDMMLGEGCMVIKGDTVMREWLRIERFGNHWAYIAAINDKAPVLFTLASSANNTIVFENKEHDFPQRIAYLQRSKSSLLAWIEGTVNGKEMKEEYPMEKIR